MAQHPVTALNFARGTNGRGQVPANAQGHHHRSDERREDAALKTLGEMFAAGSRDTWVEILREADIVAAPINTLLEASSDPDVVANGYVTQVDYPNGKRLKAHGSPWHFSETPPRIGTAPELGQHNDEALARIGYSPAQIADLRARKII